MDNARLTLIVAVGAVGVLHTLVPDHWVPIALVARHHGWTRAQTIRAALGAGGGHVLSTLAIGLLVWYAGVAFAARFGTELSAVSGVALIAFGLWIFVSALLEVSAEKRERQAGGDPLVHHRHVHAHPGGVVHAHLHPHDARTAHDVDADVDAHPPLHEHEHVTSRRTALLLVLGSSPMLEGIPAFFAAARYGIGQIVVMSIVFAAATMATYAVLCAYSAQRLAGISVGPLERYGEALSGGLIALVGAAFLIWPAL